MNKLRFLLSILLAALVQGCASEKPRFELRTGDLLFSVDKENSELVAAIQSTTGQDKDIPFSHVGIACLENGKIYVLEATSPQGVVKTPLEEYFAKTATLNGSLLIAVGRVKSEFEFTIPGAIKNAEKHLGKGYDYAYCSELVRFAFLDASGKPIFAPLAMSFRDPQTGDIDAYWIRHFEKLSQPVPDGAPGTNPADMAQSPVIEIIYKYY